MCFKSFIVYFIFYQLYILSTSTLPNHFFNLKIPSITVPMAALSTITAAIGCSAQISQFMNGNAPKHTPTKIQATAPSRFFLCLPSFVRFSASSDSLSYQLSHVVIQ